MGIVHEESDTSQGQTGPIQLLLGNSAARSAAWACIGAWKMNASLARMRPACTEESWRRAVWLREHRPLFSLL